MGLNVVEFYGTLAVLLDKCSDDLDVQCLATYETIVQHLKPV